MKIILLIIFACLSVFTSAQKKPVTSVSATSNVSATIVSQEDMASSTIDTNTNQISFNITNHQEVIAKKETEYNVINYE